LALVTGLAALTLYYYGLQRTPAVLSSLAELTYPAVAVIAGIYAFDAELRWTQWIGIALILGTVTLLPVPRRRASWFRRRRPRKLTPHGSARHGGGGDVSRGAPRLDRGERPGGQARRA